MLDPEKNNSLPGLDLPSLSCKIKTLKLWPFATEAGSGTEVALAWAEMVIGHSAILGCVWVCLLLTCGGGETGGHYSGTVWDSSSATLIHSSALSKV